MTRSMTGFGRCETSVNGREITVEIKSVNHRYFEFNCKTSRGYAFLEEKLKSYVNQKVARGKIDMYISVTEGDTTASSITVNHQLAKSYLDAMRELGSTYSLPDDIRISTLARYSDIFTLHKESQDEEQVWLDVVTAVDAALDSFISMREAEGERMKQDVLSRADTILDIVSKIEERSPQTVAEYENRLKERITELLQGADFDEQRVLTEVAIFADKVSVAEETVRLRSHFEQLNTILDGDGAVGRKIDFIIQEMNREANTIGSKVQDSQLAHMVVDIKAEIEKIREQIQNIE